MSDEWADGVQLDCDVSFSHTSSFLGFFFSAVLLYRFCNATQKWGKHIEKIKPHKDTGMPDVYRYEIQSNR